MSDAEVGTIAIKDEKVTEEPIAESKEKCVDSDPEKTTSVPREEKEVVVIPSEENTLAQPGEVKRDEGSETVSDEYNYLKAGEFSSENFKVCVKNIANRVSYGCFRSGMVSALGFKPKKIKYNNHNNYAFLGLSNEEERQKAIDKLNGYTWKKQRLVCVKAAPAKDPFVQNFKRKQKHYEEQNKRQKVTGENDEEDKPPEVKIVEVVCPYASKTYEEQLSLKEEEMRSCIERLTYKLKEANSNMNTANGASENKDNLCLDLLPIIHSPQLNNYRNKVEFGIGHGSDNTDNVVGFRLSSYREGSLTIVEPTNCINISTTAIQVAKEFQQFIQGLPYPSYNALTHVGFWQQLTVRTCTTDDVMVIIQAIPSHLSVDDFNEVQQKIINFFTSPERTIKVTSVYVSWSSQKNSNIDTYKHLSGELNIKEKLLGLQFRISPDAFFQVNTPATELLYATVRKWCDTDEEDTCVLDVCCGTGTIGLCIANGTSHHVTGIEMSQQAIEDAKFNAEFNGVSNANFICGKAEDVIGSTMKTITSNNIIAVIDPPRAGLMRRVAETLRACSAIKRIIYVSCSPKQAIDNFLWFCRPESKRFKGLPFKTVRAVPVDLFPHTRHCELIVELIRTEENEL